MLTAPFYVELPHDLGYETAWLGRDVMLALMHQTRHQPAETGIGCTSPNATVSGGDLALQIGVEAEHPGIFPIGPSAGHTAARHRPHRVPIRSNPRSTTTATSATTTAPCST